MLVVAGVLASATAILAAQLGLDRSPGWGRGRLALLVLGLVLCVAGTLLYYLGNRSDRGAGKSPSTPRVPAIGSTLAGAVPVLGWIFTALVTVGIAGYVLWYASAAHFPTFHDVHNDYADLGDAFLHGQLALLEKPSPALEALPNPYDPIQRGNVPFRWDASYFRGRYYLYWGPVPALVSAALEILSGAPPSGSLLVALVYLGLLGVFAIYMVRTLERLQAGRLGFSIALFAAIAFVNLPLLFQLGQSRIYEASILYGQFFLLAGLLAWDLYAGTDKPAWLVAAGLGWGLAVGCRYNLVFSSAIFTAFAMWWLLRKGPQRQAWLRIAGLCAPLLGCFVALALYNYARFGSFTQTGMAYQLSFGASQDLSYSLSDIPSSLYIYLLYPVTTAATFPFVRTVLFDPARLPAWLGMPADRVFDHVIFGTLPAVPALWLLTLALPLVVLRLRSRDPASGNSGGGFALRMLAAAAASQILYLAVFFYAAERYVGDFYVLLILIIAIILIRLDAEIKDGRLRLALWGLVTALAIWTIAIGYFGAFSVPPKTFDSANPTLYAHLASYWNDHHTTIQLLLDRLGQLTHLFQIGQN